MTVREGSSLAKEKIAIVGGGIASLTTAFALSDSPALRNRYALTVYQEGWLLGGKGASVRNRDAHGRIEEHGLHVWLGYYENAFTLLRRCYDELGRAPGAPLRNLRDAFLKHSAIVVEEESARGWEHWSVNLPETDDWPGDGRPLPSFVEMLRTCATQVLHYALDWWNGARGRRPELDDDATLLKRLLEPVIAPGAPLLFGPLSRALGDSLRAVVSRLSRVVRGDVEVDAGLRRLWVVFDFTSACLIGTLREGLLGANADVEALDDIEFSDSLRRHGASETTLSSGLVRAFYHLAFCDGAGAGAGLAILGMTRMFSCYRGAVFYKMRAGMGETVFSPLYEVLRNRGVRFEFFHRVRRLELSEDRRRLERVVIGRQATPTSGEYRPLVDVSGIPCWPERPLYDQLVEGEALARSGENLASFWCQWPDVETRTLEHGKDFDQVVVGISIGALPFIASELVSASARWQKMVTHVKTVRTVSMQLWVTEPVTRLASSANAPVVGAYKVPLETWADMSHLLSVEGHHEDAGVKGILYACGQLGGGGDPIATSDPHEADRRELERVAHDFLAKDIGHVWPDGADPETGGLRYGVLFDEGGREGPARISAQYLRVNASPSDRYVLSVPGSQKHRIAPGESGFERLVLAGDWTRTGYDLGCIESATMSGLQAARALGADVTVIGEVAPTKATPRIELPRYVDRPGEMALRPPYVMEDVWMNAFALHARPKALRALLDRYLNEPARGAVRYVPAGPFVVLATAFGERSYSADPVHRNIGHMSEADIAFWVPAWAMNGSVPDRFVWFLPHVFVTTGAAAAAGREIYGFPKSVVHVDLRREGRALEHLSVTGEVMTRHTPETRGERGRILEVTRRETRRSAPVRSVLASASDVLRDLLGPLDVPASLVMSIANRFAAREATLAFLKQFRDVEHADRACYQAVVEAKATVRKLRGYGPLTGSYRIAWDDHASHPFAADLGLDPGGQAAFAAWVDFDFVMESGRPMTTRG